MSTPDSMSDGKNSHWHILPWFNLLLLLALIAWTGLLSYYSWDSQNNRKSEIAGVSKKIDAIPESPDLEEERKKIIEQVRKMVDDVSKSSEKRDVILENGISNLAAENEELGTFIKEQNEKVMEEINIIKSSFNDKEKKNYRLIPFQQMSEKNKKRMNYLVIRMMSIIQSGGFESLAGICNRGVLFEINDSGYLNLGEYVARCKKEASLWKNKKYDLRDWIVNEVTDENDRNYYIMVMNVSYSYSNNGIIEDGLKKFLIRIVNKGLDLKIDKLGERVKKE